MVIVTEAEVTRLGIGRYNNDKANREPRVPMPTTLILTYLASAYKANPDAEVSGIELQHELGLEREAMESGVAELARQGLVAWDPLLSNVWLRLTDKGIALANRGL